MRNETQRTVGAGDDLFEDAPVYPGPSMDEPAPKRSSGSDTQKKRQENPKGAAGQDAQNRRNKGEDE